MAERRVTVDGVSHELAPPFLVMATQNPIDHEGTFPLPEAQLDRFMIRLSLGYPSLEEESRCWKCWTRPPDGQPAAGGIDGRSPGGPAGGPRNLRGRQGPPLPDGDRAPDAEARRRGLGGKSACLVGLVPVLPAFRLRGGRSAQPRHWRATARMGSLHSKVYEPSTVAGATLLLDFHEADYESQHEPYRSEVAVTATASIAHAIYEMGQQIGLVTIGRTGRPHPAGRLEHRPSLPQGGPQGGGNAQ